jgi:hypothetical protein
MKKIINGHLYDTDMAVQVAQNTKHLEGIESPTGERCDMIETLYREIVLKPGLLLSDARKKQSWGGYTWIDENIDHSRGAFFMVAGLGWSGTDSASVRPMYDEEARSWFERHHGGDVDLYVKFFGTPSSCLPSYQKETEREHELRMKDDEIDELRKELDELKQKLNGDRHDEY